MGRLVNHGNKKECNCRMKVVVVDVPYLCLFATRDIDPGEELLYNYGLAHYPWETKVSFFCLHDEYFRKRLDYVLQPSVCSLTLIW